VKYPNLTELRRYLEGYRRRLEGAWTAETASPNLPWGPGKPPATGQCSASSLVLAEDLQEAFGPLDLQLATGTVWSAQTGSVAITLHVWLVLHGEDRRQAPWVIDLTADQSPQIERAVTLATLDELLADGLAYAAYTIGDLTTARPQTQARAALLRRSLSEQAA
jgi:hypothetical protein